MNISYKFLLSIFITLSCLGMEQIGQNQPKVETSFLFEPLPLDMQKLIINQLVQDVITQKSETLSRAQTYREYKELLIQELNSYKSISKNLHTLISNAFQQNKDEFLKNLLFAKEYFSTSATQITISQRSSTYKMVLTETLAGVIMLKRERPNQQ